MKALLPENDEMTDDDRSDLVAALDEGSAQFERGEFEDASTFARKLAAKS